jgi:chromosome segregation ATPase
MEVADKDWFDLCDKERKLQQEITNYNESHKQQAGQIIDLCTEIAKLQADRDKWLNQTIEDSATIAKLQQELAIQKTAGEQLGRMRNELAEQNKNCRERLDAQSAEIARLENKYAVLDKQYHNMFEIKEKDNEA